MKWILGMLGDWTGPALGMIAFALIAVIGVDRLRLSHARTTIANMQAKVDASDLRASQAEAANHGTAATIAALQMSQAQCESGRIADQVASARALADHDAAAALILAQLKTAKKEIADLFDAAKNPTCAAWAKQPACTP